MRYIVALLLFLTPVSGFSQDLEEMDIDLLRDINQAESPFLTDAAMVIANSEKYISFGVPVVVLSVGLVTKNKKTKVKGLEMCGSVLMAAGISTGLKYIVNRERPFDTYPISIEKRGDGGSPSFPSGHVTTSFATATSLSLCYPKWYVIAPAYLWAGTVAYSRMYQGVHYPSDVLAGMIIGAGSAIVVHKIRKNIQKNNSWEYGTPKF